MPKIDLEALSPTNTTGYPEPYNQEVAGRWYRSMGEPSGLTEMGASHVTLKPGAWSSHRHWHDTEDELLIMLSGEAVLVEDEGRTLVKAGDICVWPKGNTNGHHLRNESDSDCAYVAISAGPCSGGGYSDIDMMFTADAFVHKDGTPYDTKAAD